MASASAMPPSRLAGFCCAAAIAGVGDEGAGRGAAEKVWGVGPRLAFDPDGRVWRARRGALSLSLELQF